MQSSNIPESYIDAFDRYSRADQLDQDALQRLQKDCKVNDTDFESILTTVLPAHVEHKVDRGHFNVVFLLLALAQQGKEISLDAVDDLKSSVLPVPSLNQQETHASPKRSAIQDKSGSAPSIPAFEPQQTTLDAFLDLPSQNTAESASAPRASAQPSREITPRKDDIADPWSPNGSQAPSFNTLTRPSGTRYSSTTNHTQYSLDIDGVLVRALEGKEGLPLWKHINYE